MRTVSELKAIAAAYDKTTSDAHMFASTPVLDICKQQFKYRQEGREITEQELFVFFQKIMFTLQVSKSDENYENTCMLINSLFGLVGSEQGDDLLQALQQLNESRHVSITQFFQVITHPSPLMLANAYSELTKASFSIHEMEYMALYASTNPMVSAKSIIAVHQQGYIPTVEESAKIITHKNPMEMAQAFIMFRDEPLNQSRFVKGQINALLNHPEPIILADTYCKLIRGKISLTPAQNIQIGGLKKPDLVVQPLIDVSAILSVLPNEISTEIKDAIIVHKSPNELAEAILLINHNIVHFDDTQRHLVLNSDNPQALVASYLALQQLSLTLTPVEFSSIVNHPQSVELINELCTLNSIGVSLASPELGKLIAHEHFKDVSDAIIHLKTHAPSMLVPKNIQMIIEHSRPKFVLATLKGLSTINKPIDQAELSKIEHDVFHNWRSDITPTFEVKRPLTPDMTVGPTRDYLKQEAIKQSWKEYKKSLLLMERSVADLSLRYIRKTDRLDDPFPTGKLPNENAGPLLQFANLYSSRYLDLYTAYVSIEYKKGIPMVPVTAGQMKLHGFTSEDIIQMQPECKAYSSIVTTLKTILNEDGNKAYDRLVVIMVGNDKLTRQEAIHLSKADFELKTGVALSDKQHQDIITQFKAYDQLPAPGASLIKKAHFLMHEFGHLPYESIANQLAAVGKMDPRTLPNESAQTDARLLMEIRHRVSGDSTIHQNSPGTLGGNPLSYLNVLTRGEPENPEAEFRNKMFFVYMSNHFANAVIQNDEKIGEINQWLKDNGKDWSLDMNFITTMRQRGAQYMPPIFRYGANANLNREFRHIKSDEDVAHFYQRNPNVSLVEAMEESAHFNALHRVKLSDREYFNQIGELGYTQNDPRNEQQLNFGTGAAIFDLATAPSSTMSHETQTYLRDISELGIPVCAGISGTLDQSTAMAGLVGLGVHEDMDVRRYELETIRLAYLAFMLPGGDHTVHEIMQSGKTFGLPYIGGPGYEAYIYPEDGGYIKEQLRLMQELRGSHLPEYFFSEEYLDKVLDDCEARASSSQVEREKFYERLDAAKLNTLNPELMKKLSPKEYQAILAFFTDDQNTLLKGQLSQLEKGQSCRFAKEDTGLPRTINIFRNREGEYKLLVDTKRKLADGIKDLNAPVVHGAGKSSWRLDVQEEYLGVTTSVDPHDQKHGAYLDEIKIKSERTQAFGERSSAICATDIGVEFDKGDTKKVTVYSRKAIGTLDTVLERLGDNTGAKNKLISDLLHGVKAMHDLGYVHQDLKPENLLVYDDGQGGYTLKLTGFDGVKKQGDDRQYAAGAHKFQSPELAYYYTNAFDKDNANRDYGQKYYAQELGLIGRLAIDSPEGAEKYPQQAQLREQYKLPNKGNDMWAVGMLVYYIQHGILPETVSDIEQAKTCPLLKGLLDISRDDRIDIDSAISINQSIVASEGRQFDKKEEGQRYYVAISLKDAPTSGVGQDSRQTLGDDMAQCLENLGGQGIQRIDRDNWHVTVGWLENRASENTPISAEDYNRIAPAIASIVEKYAQLEFELSDFSPNEEKLGVHANFNEKTGQLESLRHEIKEMVHQIAPQVDFKFSRPHALVASSQAPIDKDKLTPVTTAKIYGISNIDMMYYDDKTHRPVIAEQYSTHSTTPPPVAEKLQDSHEEASVGLEPTLDGLVVTPQNAKEKETKPVAHAPTFFAAAPQYKKQLTQFKDEPPVDVAGTVVGNIQKQ